jgi:hypothetical protein
VPEQVLPILEGHASSSKPSPEGVLEIVDAHLSAGPLTRRSTPV